MTRHILTTAAAVAALALGGCGRSDETAATNAAVTDTTIANTTADVSVAPAKSAGQAFADTVATSDAFEIESSRLAQQNAASTGIKTYAGKMIAAHEESTAQLKTAAAAASPAITPVATMTADQQAKLAAMRTATGADFDRLYVEAQKAAHTDALAALRAYAASGDVASLKAFATDLSPKVAAHLNMANALKV
ncbi:hypothetical protein ASE86_01860 [Sphingomonas sp. Leaf33]|uniref:DUF4142 domain-containing protein n=1 Tax=Sphingomonas sp. Leaf33 TaxID=1736215 RepID=UPI000700DD38|nr:DUF4142 domain-containing protein [Sphingomonas sp. Leaf33]KQN26784.1 hypothetical protein ASE86_01860 [Sphingomonas sp. Leaf33]